ncbi:MAG: TraB/GumN family protein, partial [bacterium]
MRFFRFSLLTLLLFLMPKGEVSAQSSVWKVENDLHRLFIGGTVHVLSAEDYPLPQEFDRAYAQSQSVILEADIDKLKSPEFQQLVLSEMIYTDGTNLRSLLSDETYAELEAFCATRGIPASSLMMFKPGMVSMSLTMLELRRLGLMGAGVDAHFNSRARQDGKTIGKLETVEQQLS